MLCTAVMISMIWKFSSLVVDAFVFRVRFLDYLRALDIGYTTIDNMIRNVLVCKLQLLQVSRAQNYAL